MQEISENAALMGLQPALRDADAGGEVRHPIPPVFDARSEILILGSFPSVRSRQQAFFYAHPQNRFWRILAALYGAPVPCSTEQKRVFLLQNRIALWDVIASCRIEGSSDSSIRDVRVNDISPILSAAPIRAIFANGKTAWSLYERYIRPCVGREAVCLPSSSPANAAMSIDRLLSAWRDRIFAGP